jgi:hypothetical protein
MVVLAHFDNMPFVCGLEAARIFSLPAPAQFVEGVGGFHKPSESAVSSSGLKQKSAINDFLTEERAKNAKYKDKKGRPRWTKPASGGEVASKIIKANEP